MVDIALSPIDHDILVTAGDLSFVKADDAIRQDLNQRLEMFLGEWFLDNSQGLPYFQVIFVKNPNLDLVQAAIKTVILNTPGIIQLLDFNFAYDNGLRTLTVQFDAKSTNGTVISVKTNLGV